MQRAVDATQNLDVWAYLLVQETQRNMLSDIIHLMNVDYDNTNGFNQFVSMPL